MAPTADVEKQWQLSQRIEKQLDFMLNNKESRPDDIDHSIQELRSACEVAIFLDIKYATDQQIERHLWDMHSKINARYRKIVTRFRDAGAKDQQVEQRKWEKRYVDFLKTSQYFYKSFVQRLASHFDLPELRKIAHRLRIDRLSVEDHVPVDRDLMPYPLNSCHATLLRLGDLSRYRNVVRTKERSWDTAMGYYSLANDLYPTVGLGWNQMAVISTIDGNHLDAIYYLYRALAIEVPAVMAPGNLVLQFQKIIDEWEGTKKILSRHSNRPSQSSITYPLVQWFVRLHARLYKGQEFKGHDELENEVLGQLTVTLKEKSLEDTLDKFVLINIAAEYYAAERVKKSQTAENIQSYYFMLRLNVRTLFMFLQILQSELAGNDNAAPDVFNSSNNELEAITAVMRRILPALTQYSTWLVTKAEIIVDSTNGGQDENGPLAIHGREMWAIYASTLTMLVAAFPVDKLPQPVEYLLEEDAQTVGFKPLRDSETCINYQDENGRLKPFTTDRGVERSHPNIEMMARVRQLLRDGMLLVDSGHYPIRLDETSHVSTFRHVDSEPSMLTSGTATHPAMSQTNQLASTSSTNNSPSIAYEAMSHAGGVRHVSQRIDSPAPSDSLQSMNTDLYHMVDNLVTTKTANKQLARNSNAYTGEETSYGMHSATAADLYNEMEKQQRPLSSHKSLFIGSSPFSPKAGELFGAIGDRKPTTNKTSDARDVQKPARQLDRQVLEGSPATPSQNRSSRGSWDSPAQIVTGKIGQRASQGFHLGTYRPVDFAEGPATSSNFTNQSSLYGGTPLPVTSAFGGRVAKLPQFANGEYKDLGQPDGLQSSLWDGTQPAARRHFPTPPGGQGG